MKTSQIRPIASSAGLAAEPTDIHAGPQREQSDIGRPVAVASDRKFEAFEHAWELGEHRLTAAECSTMPVQQLHQLCDEAFTALDVDVPAWGARDEYEILCAELTLRANARQNRPTSANN